MYKRQGKECSGHGKCTAKGTCTCQENYFGANCALSAEEFNENTEISLQPRETVYYKCSKDQSFNIELTGLPLEVLTKNGAIPTDRDYDQKFTGETIKVNIDCKDTYIRVYNTQPPPIPELGQSHGLLESGSV